MTISVGQIVEASVVKVTQFGAFCKLESGETGLVHISEVDRNFVADINEHLREEDKVTVKIVAIKDDGKIDLSIKQADPDWDPTPPPKRRDRDPDFEQKLRKFMRSSEERLVDWRRQRDRK